MADLDLTRKEAARAARGALKIAREIDADTGWQETYSIALGYGYTPAEACLIATDLRGQRQPS